MDGEKKTESNYLRKCILLQYLEENLTSPEISTEIFKDFIKSERESKKADLL